MAVIFSILLIVSLTQGLTGGVHSYFGMTKDPQPGSGKYGPHTFCSGYASTAVISLYIKCFSYLRLDSVYRRILLDD